MEALDLDIKSQGSENEVEAEETFNDVLDEGEGDPDKGAWDFFGGNDDHGRNGEASGLGVRSISDLNDE